MPAMRDTAESLPLPLRAVRGVARGLFRDDYWRVQIGLTERRHAFLWRRSPLRPVTEAYVKHYGLTVRSGPFAGTTYPDDVVGFAEELAAKLVGAYERELYPAIEETIAEEHDALVNIGHADGLFAVGFARRLPHLSVHAFDLLPTARRLCRGLARRNGVLDRFTFYGAGDVATLRALPVTRPIVMADCEGAEVELLDPERVPWLRDATIIVELHDFFAPGASSDVPARFADSHDVAIVDAQPRYVSDFPDVAALPVSPIDRDLAIQEFRPTRMQWAIMRPRRAG
jgi:hypothetical protein